MKYPRTLNIATSAIFVLWSSLHQDVLQMHPILYVFWFTFVGQVTPQVACIFFRDSATEYWHSRISARLDPWRWLSAQYSFRVAIQLILLQQMLCQAELVDTWAVLKIMGPFWLQIILWHLLSRAGYQNGTHILGTSHLTQPCSDL